MTKPHHLVRAGVLAFLMLLVPFMAAAAPFAAFVMDGRTGKQIHAQNADTRLHPASLTKMMTLYMAFTAIERGQVRLDTRFVVSSNAASEPPSRLGLRAGQQIELRYLIRAAAVKSANDAATVIAENLGGSVPQFAAQMTGMARALGMRNSQFRNANGLTVPGHYSTARDMTILGRRLFYDFPQYYSIFSRRSADAGIATVRSTNRNFLDNYPGSDGIKTGYTKAAGFNLTASAQRGSKRIIATVLGGSSTAQRNAIMAQLLDMGFGRAPSRVQEVKPAPPEYIVQQKTTRKVQVANAAPPRPAAPATQNVAAEAASINNGALKEALRVAMAPSSRPAAPPAPKQAKSQQPVATEKLGLAALDASTRPNRRPGAAKSARAPADDAVEAAIAEAAGPAAAASLAASTRPSRAKRDSAEAVAEAPVAEKPATTLDSSAAPKRKSGKRKSANDERPAEVVSRVSSSTGRHWGVTLGRYKTKKEADDLLLRTAIQESAVLDKALRRVGNTSRGWEANFTSLTSDAAHLICDRLEARSQSCTVIGP